MEPGQTNEQTVSKDVTSQRKEDENTDSTSVNKEVCESLTTNELESEVFYVRNREEKRCTEDESSDICEKQPEEKYNKAIQDQHEGGLPLICDDWDEIADIPTIHFSFLINLVLPKHTVSKQDPKVKSEIAKINARGRQQYGEEPPSEYIPVGSAAECYQIPRVLSKQPSKIAKGVEYSDIDVLIKWNIRPIKELDRSAVVKQKLILETEGIHPGYCRLFVNDPEAVLKGVDPSTAIYVNDKCFYSAKKVRDDVKILMEQTALQQTINAAKLFVDQKGPAVGLEDLTERTMKVFLENKRMEPQRQELVAALPIVWPQNANEWRSRIRTNDWLTDTLIESIVSDGCHVVAVPHRHSKHPDIEWRLSFATSEVRLANEVVTDDQRQCYVYLKLLRQEKMKGVELLSSYHLKTAFLYSCERLPVKCWSENQGGCILYVLNTLLNFIKDRWLPSYFIPENNLLDHLTEDEFKHLEVLLTAIRTDPISPVLEFTDVNIIESQSAVTPFRNFIGPVVDDFQRFKLHRSKRESTKEFIQTLTSFVFALFLDDKVDEVVHYVVDFHDFFQKYIPAGSFSNYIYSFTTLWKIVTQCIRYFQIAIEHYSSKYPDVRNVQGHVGCLYHVLSHQHPPGSEMNQRALTKAESHFTQFLEDNGVGSPVTIDYALFLLKMRRTDRCIDLLNAFTRREDEDHHFQNCFNLSTFVTLDVRLRKELHQLIRERKIIALPSQPLAYYLLVLAEYKGQNDESFVNSVLDKFEALCLQSKSFWHYYLYGLSLANLSKFKRAQTVFYKANEITSYSFSYLKETACHVERLMKEERVSEAVEYAMSIPVKKVGLSQVSLLEVVAFRLSKASRAAEFLDDSLYNFNDGSEVTNIRGNLACLHFASAFEYEAESEESLTAIVKAETLFCTFLSESQINQCATAVDYAAFLCNQERWLEAKDILENFLYKQIPSACSNSYSIMEYPTLDETLKKEIAIHTQITAPSTSFAYYFLIKCLMKLDVSEQNIKVAKTAFTKFCEESKNDRSYSLLGYSELLNGNWYRAEHWFCKAVETSWDYTAAKQNAALCRSNRSMMTDDKYEEKYIPLCIVPELKGEI